MFMFGSAHFLIFIFIYVFGLIFRVQIKNVTHNFSAKIYFSLKIGIVLSYYTHTKSRTRRKELIDKTPLDKLYYLTVSLGPLALYVYVASSFADL
jgi:L-cystine uptake protein TcyP (sodium:dicarboxylate symporter family)